MTTYPGSGEPQSAGVLADGSTISHRTEHGRTIGIWENAKAKGAVGNGTTDDYAGVQAIFDGLVASGNDKPGRIHFPKGQYRNATASWVVPPGVVIEGSGIDTIFVHDVPGSAPLFRVDGPMNVGHTAFRNFKINGGGSASSVHSGTQGTGLGHGIHLNGTVATAIVHTSISDVTFDCVGDATHWAVYAVWAQETYIDRCDTLHCGGGGFFLGDITNGSSVTNCKLSNNGDGAIGAIRVEAGGALIQGNVIEAWRGLYGIYVAAGTFGWNLVRNWHEDNSGKNIWLDGSTGNGVNTGNIIGCNVDDRGVGSALYAESCHDVSVIGCGLTEVILKSSNVANYGCRIRFINTTYTSFDATGLVHAADDRYAFDSINLTAGQDGIYLYKGGNVSLEKGYFEGKEITAPSTPAADRLRSFVADDDGVTKPHFITADGVNWRVRGERTPLVLTDAATVTVDAAAGHFNTITLTAARTFGAPSNPTDGQEIAFFIFQNTGGNVTPVWNGAYLVTGGTFTIGNNSRRCIKFTYWKAATLWVESGRT